MSLIFLDSEFEVEWRAELDAIDFDLTRLKWLSPGVASIDLKRADAEQRSRVAKLVWAKDVWLETEDVSFDSITEAQSILRSRSRYWSHVSLKSHRRGDLIASGGLGFSKKRAINGWPKSHVIRPGGFSLQNPDSMIVCSSPREIFPGGDWRVSESMIPPSRAYAKLWEWGWRSEIRPASGMRALDLGSHPGGWTWVLLREGLNVQAVDRAEFTQDFFERLQSDGEMKKDARDRLSFLKMDAFSCRPERMEPFDWVFCDVIAEPEKSLDLFFSWYEGSRAGLCFTLKLKGKNAQRTLSLMDRVRKYQDLHLVHLAVNKHELTVWRLPTVSN